MEFRGLKAQYETNRQAIDQAIHNVLERQDFIEGKEVKEFEVKLAEYTRRKYCVSCANGTDALLLVLMACGIKEGDAVFVPDFTFFATAEVVSTLHATPVFVDVDEFTFQISPKCLEKAIVEVTEQGILCPKAVITVDLFGLPANYDAILPMVQKYQLLLIEDGAQGLGGRLHDRPALNFGLASTTSFFPVKPVGCYGDGGAVLTDDEALANEIRSLKAHGKGKNKYDNIRIGMNSRLDTIQAAILKVKLELFDQFEWHRLQEAADFYAVYLSKVIQRQVIPIGYQSSYAQYSIVLKNPKVRVKTIDVCTQHSIPTMIYYPAPIHKQEAYVKFINQNTSETKYMNAIRLSQCILSLPMHPYLKKEEIEKVCDVVNQAQEL